MLKPVPMSKVAIVGPKSKLGPTIGTLHDLGLLHIEDYAPGDAGFELGSPLPEGAPVSERLLKVRGLLKGAQFTPPAETRKFTPQNVHALQESLAEVETELSHLVERRTTIVDEQKKLDEEEAVLKRIRNFPIPLDLTQGFKSLATATGFLPPGANSEALRTVSPQLETQTSTEAEGTFLFVAAPRASERALQDALSKLQFQPVELPLIPAIAAKRLAETATARAKLARDASDVEGKIAAIRERHAPAFYALDEYLSIEADKSTAPVRFRTTRNSFMIEGWVPAEQAATLSSRLQTATNRLVFVTELKEDPTAHGHGAAHGDHAPQVEAPVQLAHGKSAGSYVLLTDTYSRPKYSEFDPTLFFYFGFPIFYGIMLGDIGYGILLLLFVKTGVLNKVFDFFGFQSKRELNRIFIHCAVSGILFGLLYTELFGLELLGHEGVMTHWVEANLFVPPHALGPVPYPLSRLHEVKVLLLLTLYIAAFHMLLGLALGFKNAARTHGTWEAVKHRGSGFLIMLAAGLAIAAGLPGLLGLEHFEIPGHGTMLMAAAGIFGVGFILFFMAEGAMAILEIFGVLSNVLSYTRLAAIGLSGAGIALAGNEMAKLVSGGGSIGGYIVAGILLLIFHGLNMALGILGPSLHSLRLHYVEFFTKFYEGGGETYAPFGSQRKYTVKEVKQA